MNKKIQLLTLGHQDKNKNVLNFIKLFKKKFNESFDYFIIGRIEEKTFNKISKEIKNTKNIIIQNRFIKTNEYNNLIKQADIIVIPDGDIYNFLHSGVIWDCFEKKKKFLAPDNKINRQYLKNYKIGNIYNERIKIKQIIELKKKNKNKIFQKLKNDFCFNENLKKIKKIFK